MSEEAFGFWTGVSYTVNYIIGAGILSIPASVVKAGLALGGALLLLFAIVMNTTKDMMVETGGRAEALAKLPQIIRRSLGGGSTSLQRAEKEDRLAMDNGHGHAAAAAVDHSTVHLLASTASSPSSSQLVKPLPSDYLIDGNRKFEVTDLFNLFVGRRAVQVYVTILSLYMYGSLWAYTSVFAKSFAENVPTGLTGSSACGLSQPCDAPMRLWMAVFALVVIPLTCMDLKEQVLWQVLMFLARILVVVLLCATVLAGYGCDGVVFAEMAPGYHPSITLYEPSGLSTMLPVAIFAFIFHHSTPVLAQPIKDKTTVNQIFRTAFIICFVAYACLGLLLGAYFGSEVDSQCNLNWGNYLGCMAAPPGYVAAEASLLQSAAHYSRVLLSSIFSMPGAEGAASSERLLGSSSAAFGSLAAANGTCTSPATWVTSPTPSQPLCVDISTRPAFAEFIRFTVVLFPALDVLSAFPLNAITLGNNLMSAVLGEAALQAPSAAEEAAAAEMELAGAFHETNSRGSDRGCCNAVLSALLCLCCVRKGTHLTLEGSRAGKALAEVAGLAAAGKGSATSAAFLYSSVSQAEGVPAGSSVAAAGPNASAAAASLSVGLAETGLGVEEEGSGSSSVSLAEAYQRSAALRRSVAARTSVEGSSGFFPQSPTSGQGSPSSSSSSSSSMHGGAAGGAGGAGGAAASAEEHSLSAPLTQLELSSISSKPWFLRSRRGHKLVKTIFRLCASVPPVIGALFVSDLGNILQVTGLFGIFIGFSIPAMLRSYSLAHERAVFALVNTKLAQVMGGQAASSGESINSNSSSAAALVGGQEGSSASSASSSSSSSSSLQEQQQQQRAPLSEEQLEAIVSEARLVHIRWRDALRKEPADKAMATPYSSPLVRGRVTEVIFCASIIISLYVTIEVFVQIAKGS